MENVHDDLQAAGGGALLGIAVFGLAFLVLMLTGCGGTTSHSPPRHAARQADVVPGPPPPGSCHVRGRGLQTAPDRSSQCTPGQWIDTNPTAAQVCAKGYNSHVGKYAALALKRVSFASYGLPIADQKKYELDHLYPVWLGGETVLTDLWPEKNYSAKRQSQFIHNPKDRLELVIYRKVCAKVHPTMTVAQARALFEGDWRTAYRRYVTKR